MKLFYSLWTMLFCGLVIFQGCASNYPPSFSEKTLVQGYVVGMGSSTGMGEKFAQAKTCELVRAKGYSAQLGSFQVSGGYPFQSVIVGPFSKLEDAIQAMEALRSLAPRQGVESRENIWVNEYYGSMPVRFKRVAYGG